MPTPAALVLDFDGLILDTETPLLDSWEYVHHRHGLTYDRAKGHNIVGHSGVFYDPWEAFPEDQDRGQLEAEFEQVKTEIILRQPILPGVVELLDAAQASGMILGVASNSTHDHVDSHLKRLKLFDYFAATTCRDDVSAPKPAPDVYLLACERLGVAPAEAMAFEDSVPGHLAAHRAGLSVVVVPNPSTRHYDFPHALERIDSLADFDLSALAG